MRSLGLLLLSIISASALSAGVVASKMIKVPSGTLIPFWITPKEKTGEIEAIKIRPFEAMAFQVTNAEFASFLRTHPEWSKARVKRVFADQSYLSQFASQTGLKPGIKMDAPVNYVSWFAAQAYCESRGMRLPSVLEWEYMAAASETKADASKDPEFLARILEWYAEPGTKEGLPPVSNKRGNLYGLHGLHGLVWEWAEDFNSSLVTGEGRSDGSLNRDLFCGAGAMAGGNKENYAAFMRFAYRSSLKGATSAWNLGFRCVKGEPQ